MKRIYDFGRRPAKRNYTVADLQALKGSGKRLSMSNPANAVETQACVDAGIDLLVIGDTQLDEVREITPTTFTGVGSSWKQLASGDEILAHAVELMGRGADMYYTLRSYDVRAWGRTAEEAMEIYRTVKRMEDVGVFSVEAECIAEDVLAAITEKTSIVTFSLGSGNCGDAVFLFVADICGEASEEDNPPKHAYAFGDLGRLHKQMYEERVAALKAFHSEVTAKNFPYPEQNITMAAEEKDKFLEALDKEA